MGKNEEEILKSLKEYNSVTGVMIIWQIKIHLAQSVSGNVPVKF